MTERAVFRLSARGLVLSEIAPGVRLQEDILDQLCFTPEIAGTLARMDERLFRPGQWESARISRSGRKRRSTERGDHGGWRVKEDLYYEDVMPGEELESAAHTVTMGDIGAFGDVTHDHHPLHTDAAFARSMGFEQPIAHGLFGLSLMEGLKSEMKLYEHTSIASLGWDRVRFTRPVLAGTQCM